MPLYTSDALREMRNNWSTGMSWWRWLRSGLQIAVVLWLLTQFIDTNLLAHVVSCLAVLAIAEVRLTHLRQADLQRAFGATTWQALRAVHERLDRRDPPSESERSDANAGVDAEALELRNPVVWEERVALPLSHGTGNDDDRPQPRHWGTTLLHREIGNLDLARKHAQFSVASLPSIELADSAAILCVFRGLAGLALVWAMLKQGPDLIPLTANVGVLLLGGAAVMVALGATHLLQEHRQHRAALKTARRTGIEDTVVHVIKTRPSFQATSSDAAAWKVPNVDVDIEMEDREIRIYYEKALVFRGCLSEDKSRLYAIYLFDRGDWVSLLKEGVGIAKAEHRA